MLLWFVQRLLTRCLLPESLGICGRLTLSGPRLGPDIGLCSRLLCAQEAGLGFVLLWFPLLMLFFLGLLHGFLRW